MPQIAGAPGNAVTVASNTEVSGFTVTAPGINGIFGNSVTNVNINCNDISGAVVNDGIVLRGASSGVVTQNTLTGNAVDGIGFDTGSFSGTVTNNVSNANGRSGIAVF